MDKRSKCQNGYLHSWKITRNFSEGVEEVCEVCKRKKFFKKNVSNREYLSYHLRQALQPNHKLFYHEYPQHSSAY